MAILSSELSSVILFASLISALQLFCCPRKHNRKEQKEPETAFPPDNIIFIKKIREVVKMIIKNLNCVFKIVSECWKIIATTSKKHKPFAVQISHPKQYSRLLQAEDR